jgi:hypothetical protein
MNRLIFYYYQLLLSHYQQLIPIICSRATDIVFTYSSTVGKPSAMNLEIYYHVMIACWVLYEGHTESHEQQFFVK